MTVPINAKPDCEPANGAKARPGLARPAPVKAGMADRRRHILDAATNRFAEHGFEATTVRQIADDVNILSGSLYHHFASKEAMLHEIVRETVEKMSANVVRISKAPVDAEARLTALILLELGEMTRNQQVHAILSNDRKFFRVREEFSYVVKAKREAYHAWCATLQDGIDAKLFKSSLDFYLTISTIIRMLNAAADWYKNEEAYMARPLGAYTLDGVIDFHLEFVLSAVRAPGRTSAPIPRAACEALAKFVA
ncbi:TetR/AcrR family transcriptional regulator [Acidocella sp.]|uniref:TetR/AcrR family transcriptional regulator n=1 Tax=Acidocella sp. TaxID=50710 RepID=UPI002638E17B|nr:TetR/AcrR family transcriptional regulator [Acidocella sp.]